MSFYADQVTLACKTALAEEIGARGLQDFCWKNTSGNEDIVLAVVDCLARSLAQHDGHQWEDLAKYERERYTKVGVPDSLRQLAGMGKFRVIMPEELPGNCDFVEGAFGVAPLRVRNMGHGRRFLVINRNIAVIGLNIRPSGSALHRANVAWTAQDADRVYDCLVEFDAIWAGAQR